MDDKFIMIVEPYYDDILRTNVFLIPEDKESIHSGYFMTLPPRDWINKEYDENYTVPNYCKYLISSCKKFNVSRIGIRLIGLGLGFYDCLCKLKDNDIKVFSINVQTSL